MKNLLSGSFFRMVAVSTGLAALPLLCVLLVTGNMRIEQANRSMEEKSRGIINALIEHQREAHDDARILLESLALSPEMLSGDRAATESLMERLVQGMNNYDQLTLYDAGGAILANAGGLPQTLDRKLFESESGGADFFTGSMQRGLPFYTYAVHDDNGAYKGLLAVFVSGGFYSALVPFRLDEGVSLYFMGNGGESVLKYSGGSFESVSASELESFMRFLFDRPEGEVERLEDSDGSRMLAIYSDLRTSHDDLPYMTVILTYSLGKGQFQEEDWAYQAVWLTVFGVAGTLALLWILCVIIFKIPMRNLLRVAGKMGEGDFKAREDLRLKDGAFRDFALALFAMSENMEANEDALRAAKDEAIDSGRIKSEFLANMSHEIRTPLNAILGMTYLVLKSDLNAVQRGYVNKIQTASKNLLHVINDILDFSKMEAGKMGIEQIRFAVRETLGNIRSGYASRAAESGIRLIVESDSEVPHYLIGDPLRLEQAISQLLEYAFKNTRRGSIRVACELYSISGSECTLRFVVADTGEGMDGGDLARLRRTFAIGSHHAAVAGRGGRREEEAESGQAGAWSAQNIELGLTIAQRLFEYMNGSIEVSSESGEGTVLTCLARFSYSLADQQRSAPFLAGNRILLADGDEISRILYSGTLKNFSMIVEMVSEAGEALKELSRADFDGEPYNFFMFDASNLEMSGTDLLIKVKKDLGLKKMPLLLAVSGVGRNELRKRAEDAGADVFLHKPIDASVLLDTLMGLYGGNDAARMADLAEALRAGLPAPESGDALKGLRVLLVEDNALNQQLAQELMEQQGIEVAVAFSGDEALAAIAQSRHDPSFDVVLMDLQMPGMDGFEATRRIREDKSLNSMHIPIIAMTAHSNPSEIGACYKAGMDDYASKPIDVDLFFKALARWLPIRLDENNVVAGEMRKLAAMTSGRDSRTLSLLYRLNGALLLLVGEGRLKKFQKMILDEDWEKASVYLGYLAGTMYGRGLS